MGRAPCCEKNGLKKGPWTSEEDQKLIDFIQKNGYGKWRTLPKNAGLERCGKSCRLRWTNYLRPDIKRGRFSFDEEETIIQLHRVLGNKWSAIAARLPGRTDNEIKNYWNTHIRKRLLRMGIDPVTHNPRLDLLDISSILSSTLYNSSHQMNNISRLLGVQQLVNPELLRLATSLLSSSQHLNNNFLVQNVQKNQFCQSQVDQTQLPPLVQPSQDKTLIQELPSCVPFSSDAQMMEPFPSNIANFNPESWQSVGMASNLDSYNYDPLENYNHYESDQSIMDALTSDNSNFLSNNFSLSSDFSTPSSTSTPMHSNSMTTYINGSSTEDEIESYCSNMLKFEIPDIFDVLM